MKDDKEHYTYYEEFFCFDDDEIFFAVRCGNYGEESESTHLTKGDLEAMASLLGGTIQWEK